MTAFRFYILLIAQFFTIYGIDSLSDNEKIESIQDLKAALEIQYNGRYLEKVKSCTELDLNFNRDFCIKWHYAFNNIENLLYIWEILRATTLEKIELETDFTNANDLKNFIEYKPEFKKVDGTKLKITEAMNAIFKANISMQNKVANSPFTQTISIIDGDKWDEQIENWIKFYTQKLDIKNNEILKKAAMAELDEAILLRPNVVFKDCKRPVKRSCLLWQTFYNKIDHFLGLWDQIKKMHKNNKSILKKSKKQSRPKSDQTLTELATDPSHLLTFRPRFFQKMKKEGQILTISEAMKAIQTASRAIFILNEPAQECPTYIDYGGDWQKQVEALEEWHKQNIKKMPPLAKADMVIHHAFTNAQKRVSKHHLH